MKSSCCNAPVTISNAYAPRGKVAICQKCHNLRPVRDNLTEVELAKERVTSIPNGRWPLRFPEYRLDDTQLCHCTKGEIAATREYILELEAKVDMLEDNDPST